MGRAPPLSFMPAAATTLKKRFTRAPRDVSQQLRRSIQLAFLLLNIWIGVQFVRFVHFYESGGNSQFASRPPGIEGWLPIASLMNCQRQIQMSYSLPNRNVLF
jgi:hypothetical protein